MRVFNNKSGTSAVYLPNFCSWRMLVLVGLITQLTVLLISVGQKSPVSFSHLVILTFYGQWLVVFSIAGVCFARDWLNKLQPMTAWVLAWLLILLLAAGFSIASWNLAQPLGMMPAELTQIRFLSTTLLVVAVVAASFLRYLYIRTQWRVQKVAQANARVQALQARIHPHFLFNSLNTIASLIPDNPESAEQATEDLADLFRGSLRSAEGMISLEEEMDLGRKYLQMEERRLAERLQVKWQVEDLPQDAVIMPLVLQPLLENAVGHGVQPKKEGGEVSVYGREADGEITITITNPLAETGTDKPGHGIALANIRERLELAFGSHASLITKEDEQQFFTVLSFPYVTHIDR